MTWDRKVSAMAPSFSLPLLDSLQTLIDGLVLIGLAMPAWVTALSQVVLFTLLVGAVWRAIPPICFGGAKALTFVGNQHRLLGHWLAAQVMHVVRWLRGK